MGTEYTVDTFLDYMKTLKIPKTTQFIHSDLLENISTNMEVLDTDELTENKYFGEYFRKKSIKSQMIVIDGSNVAYASVGETKKRPLVKNILLMVKHLQKEGFTDISVFTDAATQHRFGDEEHMSELKKLCKFQYTPGKEAADKFLYTYVRQNGCLLITNDQFNDWKLKDSWVAHHLNHYRCTFIINEDTVVLPDLSEKIKSK